MSDQSFRENVESDLRQIVAALQEILGRISRWNGTLDISADMLPSGVKLRDCGIRLRLDIAQHSVGRWRTLIHEALHAFSPEYRMAEYRTLKGWEEGVVEKLQRLLRQQVFTALGVEVEEIMLQRLEADYPFNYYIDTLEGLRIQLAIPEETFYKQLLATHLSSRLSVVEQLGEGISDPQQRITFRRSLMLAHARLTREIIQ